MPLGGVFLTSKRRDVPCSDNCVQKMAVVCLRCAHRALCLDSPLGIVRRSGQMQIPHQVLQGQLLLFYGWPISGLFFRNERLPTLTVTYETFPSLEYLLNILKSEFILPILIRLASCMSQYTKRHWSSLNVFSEHSKKSSRNVGARSRHTGCSQEWLSNGRCVSVTRLGGSQLGLPSRLPWLTPALQPHWLLWHTVLLLFLEWKTL